MHPILIDPFSLTLLLDHGDIEGICTCPLHTFADIQFAGQVIRLITRNRVLLYPDEKPDYVLPERYRIAERENEKTRRSDSNSNNNNNNTDSNNDEDGQNGRSIAHPRNQRTESGNINAFHESHLAPRGDHEAYGRAPSEDSQATLVINESILTRQGAQGIPPDKIREYMQDPNIVTWYGMDDEENPINW